MVLGLIQYSLGGRHLGDGGRVESRRRLTGWPCGATQALLRALEAFVGARAHSCALRAVGVIRLTLVGFCRLTGIFIVSLAAVYLLYVVVYGGLTAVERKRSA